MVALNVYTAANSPRLSQYPVSFDNGARGFVTVASYFRTAPCGVPSP